MAGWMKPYATKRWRHSDVSCDLALMTLSYREMHPEKADRVELLWTNLWQLIAVIRPRRHWQWIQQNETNRGCHGNFSYRCFSDHYYYYYYYYTVSPTSRELLMSSQSRTLRLLLATWRASRTEREKIETRMSTELRPETLSSMATISRDRYLDRLIIINRGTYSNLCI